MPKFITYENVHDMLLSVKPFAALNESKPVIAVNLNEVCDKLKEISTDPDVLKVVRCVKCCFANEDGTICRHGVGKDTEPDNFCKYGVERNGGDSE